jgi:hypothetical protein
MEYPYERLIQYNKGLRPLDTYFNVYIAPNWYFLNFCIDTCNKRRPYRLLNGHDLQ